jgi:hypothetical protein
VPSPVRLVRADARLRELALSYPQTVEEWVDESFRAVAPKRLVA